MLLRIILLAAIATPHALPVSAADLAASTAQLVSVLQSDAPLFQKARACQQLGEIGNRDAIPALAAWLPDPQLGAYARSGLEGISDPGAAAALRDAATTLTGPLLAGVVNSLGVIRDESAVELLRKLAADPGSGVVNEALLALGNVASPESIRILRQFLAHGSATTRAEAASACLLAADRLRATGGLEQAAALYDAVRLADVPAACRGGAARGAILARTSDRAAFLIEQFRSGELIIRNAALLTVRDIPDEKLASALNGELSRATAELKVPLLLALADCHNPQSIPAVEACTKSPEPDVRQTALTVLGRLGPAAAPSLLNALQHEPSADDRVVILDALRAMAGAAVDELLVRSLSSGRPATRIEVIRLLKDRGVAAASGPILKQAADSDRVVSIAALAALQSLAADPEVPDLIALVKGSSDGAARSAAENALAGACSRSRRQPPAADEVLREMNQGANPADRNSWIRVLTTVGYAKALPSIEAAARDSDETVAGNALEQLGRWPDPAPIDTLLKALDPAPNAALRNRALIATMELASAAIDEGKVPPSTVVQWLQRAHSAASSPAEERRLLGLLGRLKTRESFRLLAFHLDDPVLRTEAAAGVVQVAAAIVRQGDGGELRTALEKVVASVENSNLRDRAEQVLKTIPARGVAVRLFDGRSLDGWEGNTNVWRVRDQAIVGGSLAGNPQNEFLTTARSYTNFVLRLEYKLVGTEGFVNGGVQFRSTRVTQPANEMRGYQADIGAGHSGCLYDESRRNQFLLRCADAMVQRLERGGDWNRYEIRCSGSNIQLWLNDEKTVDYTEPDKSIPQSGLIGLQIHGDCKAEIFFRNLTVEEIQD